MKKNKSLVGILSSIFGKQALSAEKISELKKSVYNVMSNVPNISDRELQILYKRLVEERTLADIGSEMSGITRERVRQIEQRATKKMQQYLSNNNIKNINNFRISDQNE